MEYKISDPQASNATGLLRDEPLETLSREFVTLTG
jgi:hypothetical protein